MDRPGTLRKHRFRVLWCQFPTNEDELTQIAFMGTIGKLHSQTDGIVEG